MKYSLTLVALAAGVSQVSATFGGFHNAPKFDCPDNTDNVCKDDYKSGLNFVDLNLGAFDAYKGFKFSGFECSEKFGKRDEVTKRTFGSKCITGKAKKQKESSPKISCDKSKGVEKASIKHFQVTPDFDCDLEFHYTMPDNSVCKHRSACKKSGTVVSNTQCGGATDVTVVYPHQPEKSEEECNFGFHNIDFDCDAPVPSKPVTSSYPVATPSSTSSTKVETSSYPVGTPSTTSSAVETESYPATTPSAPATTPSTPATSSTKVETTSSYPVATPSTSSVPATTPSGSNPVDSTSSTAAVPSTTETTSLSITSYMTTSTVFTTSIQTITSCGPEVPDCPAGSATVTTRTVPVSTTICPVTETIGVSTTAPVEVPTTYPADSTETAPVESTETAPVESTETAPAEGTETAPVDSTTTAPVDSTTTAPVETTATVPGTSISATSPAGPVETLPCPGVVPSCLNTWMFSVGCKDNTDSACYCPDSAFVQNIFTCMYAHGESDEVISEAISYFQGICAPFVPTNPGIATGAETYTTILTASPTAPPAAVTTIEVIATTVVPCTNDVGEVVPSSSSTVTVSTTMTVPQVIFTTATSGPDSSVGVIPGTYVPSVVAPTATATATATGGNGVVSPPYPTGNPVTTLTSVAPTGGYPTSKPAATSAFATAGAAHVGAGMGFLGMVAMALAI